MKSDFASPFTMFRDGNGSVGTGSPSTRIESEPFASSPCDSPIFAATPRAARRIARCVARRMLSRSISSGEADAMHHVHSDVDLITSAKASRFRSVSFFESFTPAQLPSRSSPARFSGTVTAAA